MKMQLWKLQEKQRNSRIANALLRRVRDFAEIKGNGEIEIEITKFALNSLNVDEYGLDDMDNKIMRVMIENFKRETSWDFCFGNFYWRKS